jgi:SNF2 family DNA or RNA helicase
VQIHTGRRVIEEVKYDRAQNLEELARKLREFCMIRPTLEAYEDQLPQVRTELFPVDIDDPSDVPEDACIDAASFNQPALAEVRRLTGINKASAAKPYLETLIAGGDRPIIWCWHQEVAVKLAHDLGGQFIHGGVPIPIRQDRCRRFISGAFPALVLTIAAAGTGLDGLQHATDLCVFVEEAFTPAENEQALARIHRLGQYGSVRRVRVVSRTLVDRVVEQANIKKAANAEGTLR